MALGPLIDEVAFVGGASVALWITDPAAPAPRPTKDVDVVVEVTTRAALSKFEARLRERGFHEDIESGVICRWRRPEENADDRILDAMPATARLLGFTNEWQGRGLSHAAKCVLPSGTTIRAISPPYLLATKLEAFRGRGGGDHLGSRDLEDIVLLVDGREELTDEVAGAEPALRLHLGPDRRAAGRAAIRRRNLRVPAARHGKPATSRDRRPAAAARARRPLTGICPRTGAVDELAQHSDWRLRGAAVQ